MRTATIIAIVKYAALIAALSTFLLKRVFLLKYKARANKPVSYKWIGWYMPTQLMATTSDLKREFMQNNNRLSTIMWICIALLILLFFFPQ